MNNLSHTFDSEIEYDNSSKIKTSLNSSEKIGKILQRARKHPLNDFSLKKTAAMSGVDKGYISRIERGQQSCSLTTLNKLCEVYRILPEMVLIDDYPLVILEREKGKPSKKEWSGFLDAAKSRLFNALLPASNSS